MTSPFARRSSLTLVCIVLGLAATTRAATRPEAPVDLRWEAPQGCPQESDVRSRIQKIVGAGRHDNPFVAEAKIVRIDKRFRLELEIRVHELVGVRTIESVSCDDLAGAAAVEIGLLIHSAEAARASVAPDGDTGASSSATSAATGGDGSGHTSSSPRTSSPRTTSPSAPRTTAPTEPAKVEAEPQAEPEPTRETARPEEPASEASPRRWRALLQLPLLGVGVGPMPSLSKGYGLGIGLEYARWQAQLGAIAWRPQHVTAPDFPGYGADVDRIALVLAICREYRAGWFGFSPCLTGGTERVSASGTGRSLISSTPRAFAVAVGAAAQTRLHVASWLRFLATVGGQIQIRRPELTIDGLGPVYGLAPAALNATLGVEWAL